MHDTYTRYYPDGQEVHFDAQGRHTYTLAPDGRQTVYTYNDDDTVATMGILTPGGSAPLLVVFSDTSAGPVDAWRWDFGDGATSAAQHPAHLYTQSGQFDVTLTVSNTRTQVKDAWTWRHAITVSAPLSPTGAPAIAYNPATQGYLWVWQQEDPAGRGVALYGQQIAADGSQSAPFAIVTGSVSAPAVAYNPDLGQYLVVWQTAAGAIQGRTVLTAPPLLGSATPTFATTGGQSPQVAYQRDDPFNMQTGGHWLVVWAQRVEQEQRVLARALSSNGTLETAYTVGSGGDLTAAEVLPALTAGSAGEFLAVWPSHTTNGVGDWTPYTLHARRVAATGALSATFAVTGSAVTAYTQPQVVYNPDHDLYLVAWAQKRSVPMIGDPPLPSVWVRQINVNGSSLSKNFYSVPLQVSAALTATRPAVTYFAAHGADAGQYLAAWTEPQTGGARLAARRLTPPTLAARGVFTLVADVSPTATVALARGGALTRTLVAWPVALKDFTGVGATFYQPLRGRATFDVVNSPGQPAVGQLAGQATPAGLAAAWQWDFGDGAQAATRYPQHTYTPGQFAVTLTLTDTDTGESAVQTGAITSTLTPRVITYTYDSLNRLVAADYSTGEHYAYRYDAVGNRVAMTDSQGVTTYAYDAANRLIHVQLPDSRVQPYTWDQRGNLLDDGTFTYTYNAAGRMVRAQSLTATLVYTYNADGLRIAQDAGGWPGAQFFTWDWATPVPELLTDDRRTYLVGLDTLGWEGARTPMGPVMWTYALPDALGSVRQETDATGAVTLARAWSPYGEELGIAQNGLGYTGEWFDAAVGLTYLRARWYDGGTGRFTQRDLVATSTFYRYASNNPVNRIDPTVLNDN